MNKLKLELPCISPNEFERRYNIGTSKNEAFTELESV